MNTTARTIHNTHTEIVKKIGGKKIKKFTSFRSEYIDFEDALMDIDENVVMLKNSNALCFCTYDIRKGETLLKTDVSTLTYLEFQQVSPNKFIIICNDGLYWKFEIEL